MTNSSNNSKRVFTVVYCAGNQYEDRYVDSISDFEYGGFCDLEECMLMSEEDAIALKAELEEYVRTSGKFSQESIDAMESHEWGFRIDEIELPEDEDEDAEKLATYIWGVVVPENGVVRKSDYKKIFGGVKFFKGAAIEKNPLCAPQNLEAKKAELKSIKLAKKYTVYFISDAQMKDENSISGAESIEIG